MHLSEQTKGVIAVVVMTCAFAAMAVFARYLDGANFSLFEQVYLRLFIAFLLGCVLFWKSISISKVEHISGRDWCVLTFRSLSMYLWVVLFTEAILHTKLANATIVSSAPLLPLLAYVFLSERMTLRQIAYILLGSFGVVLMSLKGFSLSSLGYGELCAFISMILFDLSYIARRWQSEYLNNHEITLLMFLIASGVLFIVSVAIGESHQNLLELSDSAIVFLLLAGLANVVTLLLTNYGLQKVPFALSANLFTLENVFSLLFGIVLFSELPTTIEVMWGLTILYAAYQMNRAK